MGLKKDRKLKEMVNSLTGYCIEQGYNCVVSVDEDETEDSVIGTNGTIDSLSANIVATVMDTETAMGQQFSKLVLAVLMAAIQEKEDRWEQYTKKSKLVNLNKYH